MAELRTPRSAAQRVAAAERALPGALELAALVPQAARIERRLLRALRLYLLPHRHAADEADLWTSDLVELRALDGLVLRADVQEVLRQRGRDLLQQRAPRGAAAPRAARLHRAHQLLLQHHANLPPLVQLEEELAWLAMVEPAPDEIVERRLETALAALVRERRLGVARWAARALPRLPPAALGTRTAWLLAVASSQQLPPGAGVTLAAPARVAVVDLQALAPQLGETALGVRRIGDRLELGAVDPGGMALMVPASEPRLVTVASSATGPEVDVAVPAGQTQVVDVGWEPVTLRAANGRHWVVPELSDEEQGWLESALRTSASGGLLPAQEVPQLARVISFGRDGDGQRVPVVGAWLDDVDAGPGVLARTRALPASCVGALVVHEGRLAGVVKQAFEERSNLELGSVRMLVDNRPDALVRARGSTVGNISVQLLPASLGAAVLVSWGPSDARHHLLVDGGPRRSAKTVIEHLHKALGPQGRLELLAVTHADADRVEGAGAVVDALPSIGDIWFNGPEQLRERFGVTGAHSMAVERFARQAGHANRLFSGQPIVVPPQGPFPRIELPGGATITVLAPDERSLAALAASWNRAAEKRSISKSSAAVDEYPVEELPTEKSGRRPPKFGTDRSVNNGASLVLLFECEGRSVLLPGDAHAATLVNVLRRLAAERGRAGIFVDVFLMPHAGSRGNVVPELFDVLEAGTYAVSTDGSTFGHPDPETIALIARRAQGATLAFNYRSKSTEPWASEAFQREHRLRVVLPVHEMPGVLLQVGDAGPVGSSAA